MKDPTMPDFIIIGGQRCGTTSLYYYLISHPSVITAEIKELCFFDLNFHKGISWYRNQFFKNNRRSAQAKGKITGEASPYYFFHPLAAERVAKHAPYAKLILMLRDPVERAYSHYQHMKRLNMEDLSFSDAVDKEKERLNGEEEKIKYASSHYNSHNYQHYSYLKRGIYIDQIKRWFNFFPREQFLIINCEDFFQDPEGTMRRTEKFLGIRHFEYGEFENFNRVICKNMDAGIKEKLVAYYSKWNKDLEEYLEMDFGWNKAAAVESKGIKISIVISLRNTAACHRDPKRLGDVLISLKNQTVKEIEIIVSDIDSDEEYRRAHKRICECYGARHIYTKTDKAWNISRARNIGIKHAIAPYVMTTDVDCVFAPKFIETALKNMNKNVIAHCRVWELAENYSGQLNNFMNMKSASILRDRGGYGTCQIFSRDWAFKIRGFDEEYVTWGAEDTDFYVRALQDNLKEIWLEKQTDYFHQWHSQTNRNENPELLKRNRGRCVQTRNNELSIIRNQAGWSEKHRDFSDIAILITTFLRDEDLFRCVESIRKFYPNIAVYIGDNGEPAAKKTRFCNNNGCTLYQLPFDLGVSGVRNEVMRRMPDKHRYIVVCDDDTVFTKKTKLETWRIILDADADIAVVGGMLKINDIVDQKYEARTWIENNEYHVERITDPEWQKTKCGQYKYFQCDLTLNFFMMRQYIWKINMWDIKFKIAFEHSDFFLRLKYQADNKYQYPVFDLNDNPVLRKESLKVVYTPDVWAYHNRATTDKRYKKYRRRPIGWILFADKWRVNTLYSSYNQNGAAINLRDLVVKEK